MKLTKSIASGEFSFVVPVDIRTSKMLETIEDLVFKTSMTYRVIDNETILIEMKYEEPENRV